jgi:hypothetical protein
MSDHIPTVPGDPEAEAVIAPDHAAGAWTNCTCSDCQEKRIGPAEDHRLYTPHDMADAWMLGYQYGVAAAEKVSTR